MSAKAFNENWQKGQTAAGKRLPALQRKYESVLRANAKKVRANYEGAMTAAGLVSKPPPGIELDETKILAWIHQDVEGLRSIVEREDGPDKADKILADYEKQLIDRYYEEYRPGAEEIAKRLNGIPAVVTPDPPSDSMALSEPGRKVGGKFTVGLPEDPATNFTVFTESDGTIPADYGVGDVLDVTDRDYFAGDAAKSGRYVSLLRSVRGDKIGGETTLYRGMSAAEKSAWEAGGEIPPGKFFTSDATSSMAQDIQGQFPDLYEFNVANNDVVETDPGVYQLIRPSTLKDGKIAAEHVAVSAVEIPGLIDESGLKVAITARTLAERRRMAKMVATPLVGAQKPSYYEPILSSLGKSQAEEATKAIRDALNQTISDALDQGWTVPETAAKIQETMTDYATWEATRLARTDLVGISNAISLKSAQSLGDQAPKYKRWLSAGDELVRESHQEVDGSTVASGKTFSVGGFPMDHPGDWLAPAEERINCRCSIIWLDTADAKASHSFEGGIVEDPIALASDKIQEALAAAAVDFSSGSMIALYPSNPGSLVVDGAQPKEDLHITLCFLPEGIDGDREQLTQYLHEIAQLSLTLEGEVGGMGYFAPGDDGMPVIALPDVVGLNEIRTAVAAAVEASGTTYATTHGFLPHITIEYVADASTETPDLTGLPLEFVAISLVEGESRSDFAFASEPDATLEGMDALSAATFTEKQRTTLAKEGIALPDGSFPIRNRADLSNAIASLGRAKDVAAAKKHIIARARDLGALDELPDAWGITAAGLSLYTDEPDPWYAEPDTAPISALVEEHEKLFKGNQAVNRRFGVQVPNVYDSSQAALESGLAAMTSAGAPLAPPDDWFEDPGLDAPTPLTVTEDGRVMGHLGEWGKCHIGIGGRCVMIPRSATGYSDFHNGGLVTASGKEIRVGKITLDTGHALLQAGASRAAAHYDHTGHVGAFVRAGEDQFGPWLSGAVRSDATPEQIRDLRANPPSGDWRKLHGRNGLELIAALAVPVQGFPVAALAASGEVTGFISGWGDTGELALVASGEPEEMEREWDLLIARLDGMEGLAALVATSLTAATITIDIGEEQPIDLSDGRIDGEIGLQIGYFRDHGYWSAQQLSGSTLTPEQMTMVQTLAPMMVENPDSDASVALRNRLDTKGLLV